MAMSKKCFVFALCVIVAIIVGAVIFVVIQTQGHEGATEGNKSETEEDEILIEETKGAISVDKAEMMCESIINGTEPKLGAYNHPSMYQTTLGVNTIATRVVTHHETSDTYQKNSYWLTGDNFADREAISMIRAEACQAKIPVIVIKMRPSKGLSLSRNIQVWNHYQPKSLIETWTDYDKKLNSYLKHLVSIPSIVILEPDLLMFSYDTHNLQYGWLNDKYKEEFYQRAQRVIKVMSRSWVYVDAGNAAYLKTRENMEHMAKSLLRLDGLRGFSINTAHFFNTSYNNLMARRLHCLTGLHYITDTSRNGGPFSRQGISGIESCYFDPPRVLSGLPPGWSWGIKLAPRQKRWTPEASPVRPTQQQQQTNPPGSGSEVIRMPSGNPPDPGTNPEAYNQYINNMRNNGAHSQNSMVNFGGQPGSIAQPQPNNHQPSNANHNNNNNGGPRRNGYNDLAMPSGRVPIKAIQPAPTKTTFRSVQLRTKEEALAIFRRKTMMRGKCIRLEAVRVHDANVWIKAPGEADGRLYTFGTYHKCLLGHSQPCAEECRLITHAEQRSSNCGCEQTNDGPNSRNTNQNQQQGGSNQNPGVFFPESGSDSYTPDVVETPETSLFQPRAPPAASRPGGASSYTSLADILRQGR
uniref:uncharacterized protein LOC120346095 n=1 Tax=Styela clava TaxID=7725 RepID=UPI00193A6A57|nr:uncharacterized protein LOC120346095 [Styela clava]